MIVVALGAVGLLAVIVAFTCSAEIRLCVAAALACPQVFLDQLGDSLSISALWSMLIVVPTLLARTNWRDPKVRLLLAVVALSAVSIVLLSRDRTEGVLLTARMVAFLALLALAVEVGTRRPRGLERALLWFAPAAFAEAVLVIWFRFDTAAEEAFIRSAPGRLLIGPSTASTLYTTNRNNVIDPLKSGGVFVNGNVASMFLGVAVAVFVVLAIRTGRRGYYVPALVCWLAVFATGSKTGALLAVVLPVCALLARILTRPGHRRYVVPVALAAPFGVLLVQWAVDQFVPESAADAAKTFGYRTRLWQAAADMFTDSPVLGLGFGGWDSGLRPYVARLSLDEGMPPHNLLIATWANLGLVGALVVLAFMIVVVAGHLRFLALAPARPVARVAAWSLVAWAWVFIHGMGDNTTLYGDLHTMLPLVVLGAFVWTGAAGKLPAGQHVADGADRRAGRGHVVDQRLEVRRRPGQRVGHGGLDPVRADH